MIKYGKLSTNRASAHITITKQGEKVDIWMGTLMRTGTYKKSGTKAFLVMTAHTNDDDGRPPPHTMLGSGRG